MKDNEEKGCGGFALLMLACSAVLELLNFIGVAKIRWYWVLSPLWIPAALLMLVLFAAFMAACVGVAIDEIKERRNKK